MPDRLTDAQVEAMRVARRKLEREEAHGLSVAQQAGLVAYVNGLERRLAALPREDEGLREAQRRLHDAFIQGDEWHPDGAAYRLVNLREALDVVPDTGDWHAEVRSLLDWLIARQPEELRNRPPNQTADEQKARLAVSPVASREVEGPKDGPVGSTYEVFAEVRHHSRHCEDWEQRISQCWKLADTGDAEQMVADALREWADEIAPRESE